MMWVKPTSYIILRGQIRDKKTNQGQRYNLNVDVKIKDMKKDKLRT